MRTISRAIDLYSRRVGRLPDSLGVLLDVPDAFVREVTLDPLTGLPYAYAIDDPTHYRLCALFQTGDLAAPPGDRTTDSEFWRHPVGQGCFRFEATTDLGGHEPL